MPMIRYFGVLASDLQQEDLQRKSSLIVLTDVNMASKRAFLQKVTV